MAATIPFYPQSFEFTCGPASLIMAMQAFDPSLEATRELEIDIWREANLVEAYATSRQGLALAAHRRGFQVRMQGNAERVELLDCLGFELGEDRYQVATALHNDLKRRAQAAEIPDEKSAIDPTDVQDWLEQGFVPIVLVDARLVGDEALPHWVLVTGWNGGHVILNDPLADEAGSRIPQKALTEHLGFEDVSCAVAIEGHRRAGPGP